MGRRSHDPNVQALYVFRRICLFEFCLPLFGSSCTGIQRNISSGNSHVPHSFREMTGYVEGTAWSADAILIWKGL